MTAHARFAATLTFLALGACTMEEPFSGPGFRDGELTTDAEGPFSVVATTFDVEDTNEANAAFNQNMADLRDAQLRQRGLVGASLSLKFMSNDEYRSLSVWETAEDLRAWLDEDAFLAPMARLGDHVESSYTVSYTIDPAALPPSWDEAQRHLDEDGEETY